MKYRKFNGKRYKFWGNYKTLAEANRKARNIRRTAGHLARVTKQRTKGKTSYNVWYFH